MRTPALLALLAAAVALPAASAHAITPRFEVTKPAGGGPELDQLLVRASCDSACTIRLKELSALRFRTRGGVAQLPNGVSAPLRGTRRAAAGATVTFRVAVPVTVQQFALGAFSRQEAVVANVVAEVQPAGGAPVEAVRQVVAVVGSTPSPYPASPALDVLRLPARAALKPGRPARWRISVAGTQTSRWSYDRTRTEGACKVIDAGSGTQKLTFRSVRPWLGEQVIWHDGELKLRFPGWTASGTWGQVRIDAVRDSREEKGGEGGCGGGGGAEGGGGGPAPGACERRGSREVEVVVGFIRNEVTVFDYDDRTTVKPDCPFELAKQQNDPLDLINVPNQREPDLTQGGNPGNVIMLFAGSDTTDLEGGKIVTRIRITVTFQRV